MSATADTAERLAALIDDAGRRKGSFTGVNQGVVSNAATPFGGEKASGLGREGGAEGIEGYPKTQRAAFDLGSDQCST